MSVAGLKRSYTSKNPFLSSDEYRQMLLLAVVAGVNDQSIIPGSLIAGVNNKGVKCPIFWCSNQHMATLTLCEYLEKDQPFYTLLSGSSVFGEIHHIKLPLTAHYVKEILTIQPVGHYIIGGI